MVKKEMIAMLLAGGQGSRLGILTRRTAKPAVAFGGKYSIIDFPLSNCINSGVDTVGVLTQYQPLKLNSHIGIGIPWDLDRNHGGVTILPPHETVRGSGFYSGTADAVFQNMDYIDSYDPEYVLILSGDHIYKMDYKVMLDFHKAENADLTIAAMPVPWEDASRFGLAVTDESGRITAFEEKPEKPTSNLASMGIYIFTWKTLKASLIELKDQENCDFGKHVIPHCLNKGNRLFAYEFNDYWKDVGTLDSYHIANMELVDTVPEFNLYEEYWKIYTKCDNIRPQYTGPDAHVGGALVSDGCEIYGEVYNSVLGPGVIIGRGSVIRDSIIMEDTVIGEDCHVDRAIIASGCRIGSRARIGESGFAPSKLDTKIYNTELSVIAENTVIPDDTVIGRNTVICGITVPEDYPDGCLSSGGYIIREAAE